MGAGRLSAQVLGDFQVDVDGERIDSDRWQRTCATRLMKLLLVARGHVASREIAAETLWPGSAPELSRANLRKALFFAHAVVPDSVLVADNAHVRLVDADVDLDRLLGALDTLEQRGVHDHAALTTLLELGRLPLLPDDLYEEWLVGPREHLASRWQITALEAARAAALAGSYSDAQLMLEQLLDRDQADEAAHRLAIECFAAEGRHHAARRQFELCRRALRELLDIEPSAETVAAFERVEGAISAT